MAKRQNRLISRIWVSSLTPEQRLDIKEKTKWWDNLFQYERDEYKNYISKNLESKKKSELRKAISNKIDIKIVYLKQYMEKHIIIKEVNYGYNINTYVQTLLQKLEESKKFLRSPKYTDEHVDNEVIELISKKLSQNFVKQMYEQHLDSLPK